MEAICIASSQGEIIYFHNFCHSVGKNVFNKFLCYITSEPDNSPYWNSDGYEFISIFRDELYWCGCLQIGSLLSKTGRIFICENLTAFYQTCSALIGTITPGLIRNNPVLIQEIILETMCNGLQHTQSADKVNTQVLSKTVSTSLLSMKNDPTQGLIFVDIIEKVSTSGGQEDNGIRSEVSGVVSMNSHMSQPATVTIVFNSDIFSESAFSQGCEVQAQFSSMELGEGVKTSSSSRDAIVMCPVPGENVLLRYSLKPTPYVLPFELVTTHTQLTSRDVELKMKLCNTTGRGCHAPKVVVTLLAPPSTSNIMSRTKGPCQQTVHFNENDKLITWVVKDLPGGNQALSTIRMVDAGDGVAEGANIEFEISKWLCSGLHIENVAVEPKNSSINKWIRYLTISDKMTFNFFEK